MRRYSFFIGAASAVLTFVALSAFTGRRPWGREARWPHGWQRHQCAAGGQKRQAMPIDSATIEFEKTTDSTLNK